MYVSGRPFASQYCRASLTAPSVTSEPPLNSPTLFSVKTNRALFRGMVHLTRSRAWRTGMGVARDVSRWDLTDMVVENHLALAFEYIMEMLSVNESGPRALDPNGAAALRRAKAMRRSALIDGGWRDAERMEEAAQKHFGLPTFTPVFWPSVAKKVLKAGDGKAVSGKR